VKSPWLSPGFIPLAPTIVPWVEAAPKPFAVTGENAAVVGKNSCLSGQTSSTLCGKILKTKLEFKWPGGEISKELVEVGLKGAGGDSGGPEQWVVVTPAESALLGAAGGCITGAALGAIISALTKDKFMIGGSKQKYQAMREAMIIRMTK